MYKIQNYSLMIHKIRQNIYKLCMSNANRFDTLLLFVEEYYIEK